MRTKKSANAQEIIADLTFNTYSGRRRPKTRKRGFFRRAKKPDAITVAKKRVVPDLNKCFMHFYRNGLPDNEEGRKFAAYMAQAQITACYSGQFRRKWLKENSPFADDEIESFLTMPSYLASPEFLGDHLEIDLELREQLGLKYIRPWDMTKQEFEQYQLDKKRSQDRDAKTARRRAEGRPTRQEWLAQCLTKGAKQPWKAEGVPERTWRHRQSKLLPGVSKSLPSVSKKNLPYKSDTPGNAGGKSAGGKQTVHVWPSGRPMGLPASGKSADAEPWCPPPNNTFWKSVRSVPELPGYKVTRAIMPLPMAA